MLTKGTCKATGVYGETKCDAGRYTDTEGQSSCLPANPGTYVPKEGARLPIDCDPGRYSGSAQSSCQECAAVALRPAKVRTPAR